MVRNCAPGDLEIVARDSGFGAAHRPGM